MHHSDPQPQICPAISAHRLWKSFRRRWVLRDVECEIQPGEVVAILGANGSGKSTLLRCLAGVTRPTSGEIRWFHQPPSGYVQRRHWVGLVAHEGGLYSHLTVRENLLFAARMCCLPQPTARVDEVLEASGLRLFATRLVQELSRGWQQRLSISRSLIHDPPIWLLDEPFVGLDAEGCAWLSHRLHSQRARGRTLFFSTHDSELAVQLADRQLELSGGRLINRVLHRGVAAAGGRLPEAA